VEAEDGLKPILQAKSVFRLVVFVLSDMEILHDRIADSHPSYGIEQGFNAASWGIRMIRSHAHQIDQPIVQYILGVLQIAPHLVYYQPDRRPAILIHIPDHLIVALPDSM
jgi:hypothetical protein